MRILTLAQQCFPDYTGGVARVVRETAVGLARRGHSVTVVSPAVDGLPAREIADGVDFRRTVRRTALPQTWTETFAVAAATRAAHLGPVDVVLAHHVTGAVAAHRLLRLAPVAYVFHASPFREARHRRTQGISAVEALRSLTVEPALWWLERDAARGADQTLVLSQFSAALLAEDHPRDAARSWYAGGGVDTERFCPAPDRDALRRRLGIREDERLLLTVRRLVGRMGIDRLIDATAQLRAMGHPVRVVIVGEGELRAVFERRRDEAGLHELVAFPGRLPDTQVLDWYRAADLFILPTVAYEGFGMVTAEALACGTPVVGTNVGATREILEPLDPRLLAADATVDALTTTIARSLKLLGGPLRQLCREHSLDQLSWSRVLPRWESGLERAVDRQKGEI